VENFLTTIKIKWWLFVATRKRRHGNYDEALEILQKITKARPDSEFAFVLAAACVAKLDRYVEALDFYERALQLAPDYGDAHAHLSLTLRALGRNQEALYSLNGAFRIKPSLMRHEFWLYELGLMAGDCNQWEQA
jgi:protein O-GlcNAc transferase